MKVYICEICGDAYIGAEKPSECPFCGASASYIKNGAEAQPVFAREGELSEETKKRMERTYKLEIDAVAIYTCMAGRAKSYEFQSMYKRLAKVELEHASIVTKFLGSGKPEIGKEACSEDENENFNRTIELEDHAAKLYLEFSKESSEPKVKIFFAALARVEASHIQLINNYLKQPALVK
jgi:rubrerythrin